jgi:putative restriction endonuclease
MPSTKGVGVLGGNSRAVEKRIVVGGMRMTSQPVTWTREHTLAALHLYLLLPFGRLSRRTPEVQQLASWQGRTASSLAMKLVNFASLDPQITGTGRAGLSGATLQDRALWSELQANWDAIENDAATAYAELATRNGVPGDLPLLGDDDLQPDVGRSREAIVEVRIGQARFRRMVFTSYGATCCISGLRDPALLVASHIVPWSCDTGNRLNPQNGLCLSALHDRAYDKGLITVLPDCTVRVSQRVLAGARDSKLAELLATCDRQSMATPERFAPRPQFLEWHAKRFGFL